MSKAILLSIKPELVAKILNGEKTIEVRKKFPADYKGWVYIYVTKGKPLCYRWDCSQDYIFPTSREEKAMWTTINGKVVARFWCDKVEEINRQGWVSKYPYNAAKTSHKNLLNSSCLNEEELCKYLFKNNPFNDLRGYAIPITQLEIFDDPKELSEFYKSFKNKYCESSFFYDTHKEGKALVQPIKSGYEYTYPLTNPPKNYCYIELID